MCNPNAVTKINLRVILFYIDLSKCIGIEFNISFVINSALQASLVNGTDSVYNLINSSKTDEALGKLYKLRSFIDGTIPSIQIVQNPFNKQIVELVDDLSLALQQKK